MAESSISHTSHSIDTSALPTSLQGWRLKVHDCGGGGEGRGIGFDTADTSSDPGKLQYRISIAMSDQPRKPQYRTPAAATPVSLPP